MNLFKFLFQKNQSKSLEELAQMVQNGSPIIDVRSPQEYSVGHIRKAQNIPLQELKKKVSILQKNTHPIVVVCRSGSRSAMANTLLNAHGVESYNAGGWEKFNAFLS